jgi:hypothetical protein
LEGDSNNINYGPIEAQATYNNDTVAGYNIMDYYSFEEGDVENQSKNYMFPFTKDADIDIPGSGPLHIEIRIFVKNNMRRFEALDYNGLDSYRFWSFSDFKNNFTNSTRSMVGNFAMALRTYNPFEVGSISGDFGGTVCDNSDDLDDTCYVAAVPAGSGAPTNYVPPVATGKAISADTYKITNVSPGNYDVYLMRDTDDSAGSGSPDGFPETAESGPISVTVVQGQEATADF